MHSNDLIIKPSRFLPKSRHFVVILQDVDSNDDIEEVYSSREKLWHKINLRGKPYQKLGAREAGKEIGSYTSFTRLLKQETRIWVNVCLPGEVVNRYIVTLKEVK